MPERLSSIESEKPFSFEILSDPETREDIRERMVRFLRAVHDRKVDTLVFLDRSARPLSWLFRAMWKREYPEENVPDVKFVNIGTATETHAGQSSVLSKSEKDVSTFEARWERIWESVHEEKWLAPEEIPRSWMQIIRERGDWADSLARTFPDAFSDRDVVLVDEIGCSGRTQMTALALFAQTFPKARKIEAATFLQSKGGEWNDKKLIPWFREEGMAGVLEIPDVESLQSASLSRESVFRIRTDLEVRIARIEHEGLALVSTGLDAIASLEAALSEIFSADQVLRDRLRVLVERWKAMHEECVARGTIRPYSIQLESGIWIEAIRAVRDSERYGFGKAGFDGTSWKQFNQMMQAVLEGPSKLAHRAAKLRAAIDAHADLPALIARSKQLRREMEELAKGKV